MLRCGVQFHLVGDGFKVNLTCRRIDMAELCLNVENRPPVLYYLYSARMPEGVCRVLVSGKAYGFEGLLADSLDPLGGQASPFGVRPMTDKQGR